MAICCRVTCDLLGYVDLNALTAKVEHDIALAKGE
jgi:hypothetical protein